MEIYKIGEVSEGMGHILEMLEYIWVSLHDFHWFKVRIVMKKWKMPNYKLTPSENIDVTINLGTVILNLSVNRFLKLSSIKRIAKRDSRSSIKCVQFLKVLEEQCITII
jgi:hypothetical protein